RLGEAAWNRATEGLGSARIADLQAAGGNLLALTNRGLYAWRQAVTAPPAAALMPPARPSMAEVRRMVLESLDALQPGTAASWQRRVRWRAAAPQVGLSLRRSLDARASRTLGNTISLSTTENRIVVGPDGESVTDTDG